MVRLPATPLGLGVQRAWDGAIRASGSEPSALFVDMMSGQVLEGEHTFHGCVGVREAVGKACIYILQLQPLQGSFQTWVGEE